MTPNPVLVFVLRLMGAIVIVLNGPGGLLGGLLIGAWCFGIDLLWDRAFGSRYPWIVKAMQYAGTVPFGSVFHVPFPVAIAFMVLWWLAVQVAWDQRVGW